MLEKWVTSCGSNLSRFFAEIEASEGAAVKTSPVSKTVAGYDRLYEMLTVILSSGNPRRIHGITINLEDISAAAEREMADDREKIPGGKKRRRAG